MGKGFTKCSDPTKTINNLLKEEEIG